VAYAIDSTILGGAYANKIDIIATEQGGRAHAGGCGCDRQRFHIDRGRQDWQSNISAARNAAITSTRQRPDAIHSQGASLSAGRT
jgi:hypothetical protein